MAWNNRNLLNLRTLRLLAIVAPVACALALGLTTDLFLNDALPGLWPEIVATFVVAVGAVIFSSFIFWLLRGVYGRIDEQNRELERSARELRDLRELEGARAGGGEGRRAGRPPPRGAIQSIYAVVLRLEDCAERLHERPDEVAADLEKAMDDLNKVIQDIRSYNFVLRPAVRGG